MTQEIEHNCVAILTPFMRGIFLSPFVLPIPNAPKAWSTSSSNCACRFSMACYHVVSTIMHRYKRAAIDALMDLPPRLFLGAPVTTWGSVRAKGHKRLNTEVSSRL